MPNLLLLVITLCTFLQLPLKSTFLMSCLPGMPCYGPEIYAFYPKGCCNESLVCPVNSDIIIYSGPNLPNTVINTNDSLTVALQKIDVALGSDTLINTVLTGLATNPSLRVAFCALVNEC